MTPPTGLAEPVQIVPRYVYRVVVDMELDEKLLVRPEPVQIEDRVPFRGRMVIVERIEDTDERDVWPGGSRGHVETDPDTQLVRTLISRNAVCVLTVAAPQPLDSIRFRQPQHLFRDKAEDQLRRHRRDPRQHRFAAIRSAKKGVAQTAAMPPCRATSMNCV